MLCRTGFVTLSYQIENSLFVLLQDKQGSSNYFLFNNRKEWTYTRLQDYKKCAVF